MGNLLAGAPVSTRLHGDCGSAGPILPERAGPRQRAGGQIMTGQLLDHLALGFSVSFSLQNLLLCLLGCLVGTLIGVLPGIGPLATIAILLPITYNVDPVGALIMLAGIYY